AGYADTTRALQRAPWNDAAILLKASSCTRRRLTSSGRPNDGFWTSVAPAVFDQLSHAGGFVNQQTVHDDDVAACSSRSRSMSTRRTGSGRRKPGSGAQQWRKIGDRFDSRVDLKSQLLGNLGGAALNPKCP